MILWRISNHANLEGMGGLTVSGRWHARGRRIVYLSSSPASALLEILVHFEIPIGKLPRNYQLLEIQVPSDLLIEKLDQVVALPPDWTANQPFTQRVGNAWLDRNSSALLEIPSALVSNTNNYLLNPGHDSAKRILIISVRIYLSHQEF